MRKGAAGGDQKEAQGGVIRKGRQLGKRRENYTKWKVI